MILRMRSIDEVPPAVVIRLPSTTKTDFVSVTYNRFAQHQKNTLVGGSDRAQGDREHLRVTFKGNLFDSAITSGGLTAIVLCLLLPEAKAGNRAANHAPESDTVESH